MAFLIAFSPFILWLFGAPLTYFIYEIYPSDDVRYFGCGMESLFQDWLKLFTPKDFWWGDHPVRFYILKYFCYHLD